MRDTTCVLWPHKAMAIKNKKISAEPNLWKHDGGSFSLFYCTYQNVGHSILWCSASSSVETKNVSGRDAVKSPSHARAHIPGNNCKTLFFKVEWIFISSWIEEMEEETSHDWRMPSVMIRYRKGIDPVFLTKQLIVLVTATIRCGNYWNIFFANHFTMIKKDTRIESVMETTPKQLTMQLQLCQGSVMTDG